MSKNSRHRPQRQQKKLARRKNRKSQAESRRLLREGETVTALERRAEYATLEEGPMCFVYKITSAKRTHGGERVMVRFTSLEDTIRPVQLRFTPPLQSYGTETSPFTVNWEELTYLFNLDDPGKFVDVHAELDDEAVGLLSRYVETCRNLAGYSVINSQNGFTISMGEGDVDEVQADLPSHQEFTGFSATFRQLHNEGEEASFDRAWKIVNQALHGMVEAGEAPESSRAVVGSWRKAQRKLCAKTAATLICESLVPEPVEQNPLSLKGVVPGNLIKTYNYGDTLHWGDHRAELAKLTDDPTYAKFYKFCCTSTMVSLSHLYFGFAELIEAALGRARVVS